MNTEIKTLDALPFIPGRIRDFAFKYSTAECQSLTYWAEQYGVSVNLISKWLNRPGVREYVAICQTQKREGYLDEIKGKLREKLNTIPYPG